MRINLFINLFKIGKLMSVQVQEQKQKQQVKLSQILKNATEEQCFGHFMNISEISDLDEDN